MSVKRKSETDGNPEEAKKVRAGKKVLILGSGMCSPPLVDYLSEKGFPITIGTRTTSRADPLVKKHPNVTVVKVDMEASDADAVLDKLISTHTLTISMLPYLFHVQAAKLALKHKKHFCTTSYISDEMKALDEEAKKAGLVFLNECGVDPGTDHMNALKLIAEAREKGGKIDLCTVYAGGLPAPQCNDNLLGYKLSWAPRGVLLASRNPAHFLRDGKIVDVAGENLFSPENVEMYNMEGVGELESYPNRDSEKYISIYGIPEVKTIMRGSYRNKGFCFFMLTCRTLGFLELDPRPEFVGMTFANVTKTILGEPNADNVKALLAKKAGVAEDHHAVRTFEWLGMFSDEVVPAEGKTALDVMNCCWEKSMQYKDGEQDMIAMEIAVDVSYPDGKREHVTSTIINIGQQPNGGSAMSRTVGIPMGIATRMILDGEFTTPGVHRPSMPELYNPILDELKTQGIDFVIKRTPLA